MLLICHDECHFLFVCVCVCIRYLIPSLDRANAGHYRCIVRNRVGAIMQCSTEVQVACKFTVTGNQLCHSEGCQDFPFFC